MMFAADTLRATLKLQFEFAARQFAERPGGGYWIHLHKMMYVWQHVENRSADELMKLLNNTAPNLWIDTLFKACAPEEWGTWYKGTEPEAADPPMKQMMEMR